MHKARAPQARVSTVPPRPQNRLFEVPTFRRTSLELEDQVGLEPTVTCVDGLRIRSLGRWGHWSMIGGSGWFRTTCARVKRPLHLQSGLTLRIHPLDGCGGKPRRFRVARRDDAAPFRQSRDSDGHVGLPSVGAPVRNRTCINRLSSGRTAIVLQERELVRFHGIEPRTTAMSRRYSTSELKAHDWYPRLGSNERMSVCKTDALPLGYGSVMVERRELNPHGQARRSLSAVRLPVSPRSRSVLKMTHDGWRWREGSSLRTSVYKTAALHLSYASVEIHKRPENPANRNSALP
jgi:hypothetical protein